MKTTTPVAKLPHPADQINRVFHVVRPNALWLADLTYVAIWARFVYVALVIDAYARRIVDWRASNSLRKRLLERIEHQDGCSSARWALGTLWCTMGTAGAHISPSAIPSAWPRPASSSPLGASVILSIARILSRER